MIKSFSSLFLIALFAFWMQLPAVSDSIDCAIDEETGSCHEGECRLEDDGVGVCQSSADGCACVPIQ